MRPYNVVVREVHTQIVQVRAENKEDAIRRVEKGEGDYLDDGREFSHTMSSEFWTVEETETDE